MTTIQDKIERSIKRANAAYKKATPAKRRVMIAKDALKQLRDGKTIAHTGIYVGAWKLAAEARIEDAVQLQTLLHNPKLTSQCKVCARGSLLLSAVRFRNDCSIDKDGDTSEDSFVKEFSLRQQEMMEAAFEQWPPDNYKHSPELAAAAIWPRRFMKNSSPDARIKAILKNVIRNGGKFNPRQK